jgi:hypothetical protein
VLLLKRPDEQFVHVERPTLLEKVPAVHEIHEDIPESEYKPTEQLEQIVSPVVLAIKPPEQCVHPLCEETLLKDPTEQEEHIVADPPEYVPIGQDMQVVTPVVF